MLGKKGGKLLGIRPELSITPADGTIASREHAGGVRTVSRELREILDYRCAGHETV
jgi:hypothetical protein